MPRSTSSATLAADRLALTTSALCLVHCLGLPLVAAALPIFGVLTVHSTGIHAGLVVLALLFGVWALGRSRQQAGPWPLRIAAAGLLLMAAALGATDANERLLTVAGVVLVAIAHARNIRAHRRATN